jgi:hypothetical protein
MLRKVIINLGALLINPVKKAGNAEFSEKIVNFSNKNPWFKVLLSFFVTAMILVSVYYLNKVISIG